MHSKREWTRSGLNNIRDTDEGAAKTNNSTAHTDAQTTKPTSWGPKQKPIRDFMITSVVRLYAHVHYAILANDTCYSMISHDHKRDSHCLKRDSKIEKGIVDYIINTSKVLIGFKPQQTMKSRKRVTLET